MILPVNLGTAEFPTTGGLREPQDSGRRGRRGMATPGSDSLLVDEKGQRGSAVVLSAVRTPLGKEIILFF